VLLSPQAVGGGADIGFAGAISIFRDYGHSKSYDDDVDDDDNYDEVCDDDGFEGGDSEMWHVNIFY
jgi:hypothetical protein